VMDEKKLQIIKHAKVCKFSKIDVKLWIKIL
jgi:hypothetical protein